MTGSGSGVKTYRMPLPALDDVEGSAVPAELGPVVDAHVHLFPDRLFEAIWRWFDKHGWPIRYKLHTPEVIQFALSRGVSRIVALHYSHKPGMARAMNAYMAAIAREEPRVTPLATVFPGEPDARLILEEAFALGLKGVKLHCHVQGIGVDSDALAEIYETCILHDKPVIIHAGREPSSSGYQHDAHALCHADRTESALRSYPRLKLGIPHLGIDEVAGYRKLIERYDNLWLDTTMALADFFPDDAECFSLVEARPDRIMYGTDFPNIPYAWDRELRRIGARSRARSWPQKTLAAVLRETAASFYGFTVG